MFTSHLQRNHQFSYQFKIKCTITLSKVLMNYPYPFKNHTPLTI